MPALLKDPVVLVCVGVLLFGMVALLWAIARILPKKSKEFSDPMIGDLPAEPMDRAVEEALFRDPLAAPALRPEPARSPVSVPANANVADRLEQMSMRLAEMQSVLSKQAQPAAGSGNAGSIGQGFSPETVDKLLKIIGNVSQQVDILQKALNVSSGENKPNS